MTEGGRPVCVVGRMALYRVIINSRNALFTDFLSAVSTNSCILSMQASVCYS